MNRLAGRSVSSVLTVSATVALLSLLGPCLPSAHAQLAGASFTSLVDSLTSAPGGGTFRNFTNEPRGIFGAPVISQNGTVGFLAGTVPQPNSPTNTPLTMGAYTVNLPGNTSVINLIAREGDSIPGLGGGTFARFESISINNSNMLVVAGPTPPTGIATNTNGIFVSQNGGGGVSALVRPGTSLPGGDSVQTLTGPLTPTLTRDGNVYFTTSTTQRTRDNITYRTSAAGAPIQFVEGPETRGANNQLFAASDAAQPLVGFLENRTSTLPFGIYGQVTPTSQVTVVQQGISPAPAGGTGTLQGVVQQYLVNDNGEVAFNATYAQNGLGRNGLFTGSAVNGGYTLRAFTGQALTNSSDTLATVNFTAAINNTGTIAFVGKDSSGRLGGLYFTTTGMNSPTALIRTGDALFGSTLLYFGDTLLNYTQGFSPYSLNDNGQLVFAYKLADGRSGIALAQLPGFAAGPAPGTGAAPEPGSLALLLPVLGVGMLLRKRRGTVVS